MLPNAEIETSHRPTLVVVTGPTGSGKTALSIELAEALKCEIVSADSRQIYRGIPIVTAAPSAEELRRVKHHFVATLDLDQYYSAARFEQEVMELLPQLWKRSDYVVMCGGSMMYVDAVTRGIDDLPDISPAVRRRAAEMLEVEGIERVRQELERIDPVYSRQVDPCNHKRLVHALEICWEAGVPYSSLRTGMAKERPWRVVKVAIDHDRSALFDRINARVDAMVTSGMEEEARGVYHLRHLNSLNTVGFKEMFAWFDGEMDRTTAIERIKKNTRVYAKKQLTWMKRSDDVVYLSPDKAFDEAIGLIAGR